MRLCLQAAALAPVSVKSIDRISCSLTRTRVALSTTYVRVSVCDQRIYSSQCRLRIRVCRDVYSDAATAARAPSNSVPHVHDGIIRAMMVLGVELTMPLHAQRGHSQTGVYRPGKSAGLSPPGWSAPFIDHQAASWHDQTEESLISSLFSADLGFVLVTDSAGIVSCLDGLALVCRRRMRRANR